MKQVFDKSPKRVAITGASGQIGYSILFRIASGELCGPDQPLILHLIDQPAMQGSLKGVKMELEDCSYPLLKDIVITSDLNEGFKNVEYAFLIGSIPRGPGMERSDLLKFNGEIFVKNGKALNDNANNDAKVLVVGNPANTNCLICLNNAKKLPKKNFTALTKLDHNRAKAILGIKTKVAVADIKQMCIWGNHSPTMFPDLRNSLVQGRPALGMLESDWIKNEFMPAVQLRGSEVIKARKLSSAASAAKAALQHMHEWIHGIDDWTSFAVHTDGDVYNVPEGLIFSFPVTISDGNIKIVKDVSMLDPLSLEKMKVTIDELMKERSLVEDLLK